MCHSPHSIEELLTFAQEAPERPMIPACLTLPKSSTPDSRGRLVLQCDRHGEFVATRAAIRNRHFLCPGCKRNYEYSQRTVEIKQDIESRFGDLFDLSSLEYQGSQKKVVFRCRRHELSISVLPSNIPKMTYLCKQCRNEALSVRFSESEEEFTKKAVEVHGNRYDYSLVRYDQTHKKVTIRCSIHGPFFIRPSSHLMGQGCPDCSKPTGDDYRAKRTQALQGHLEMKFGTRFDTSALKYVNSTTKVKFRCKKHNRLIAIVPRSVFKLKYICPECRREAIGR